MLNNNRNTRKRNEVMENIMASGGSDPQGFNFGMERKYPKNFHPLIQYLYEIIFTLDKMIQNYIPNAFPITEPKYKGSPYKHSDAERLFAVPLEMLEDANSAIDVCLKLKENITAGRSLLANYYPKQLVMPTYQTNIREDQLQDDIRTLDSFFDIINKIQDRIMDKRQPTFHNTVDKQELERLRGHIIKIGYDKLTTGKSLIELYPSLLTTNKFAVDPYPNFHTSRNLSSSDSKIDELVCDISDRLLENLERDAEDGN